MAADGGRSGPMDIKAESKQEKHRGTVDVRALEKLLVKKLSLIHS